MLPDLSIVLAVDHHGFLVSPGCFNLGTSKQPKAPKSSGDAQVDQGVLWAASKDLAACSHDIFAKQDTSL